MSKWSEEEIEQMKKAGENVFQSVLTAGDVLAMPPSEFVEMVYSKTVGDLMSLSNLLTMNFMRSEKIIHDLNKAYETSDEERREEIARTKETIFKFMFIIEDRVSIIKKAIEIIESGEE